MDQHRLTVVTRTLTSLPSRRDVLRGLFGAGLGLAAIRLPNVAAAKKKRRKVKKARPNAFGCLEVGDPCKTADQCCSGICQGKKPKKGKKDKSKCIAHNVGECGVGQDSCTAEDFPCGNNGFCYHT
ncbi:MAG: hypothetical protein ACRDJC_17740, partial [Thermomicrobiales bacterium]